MAGSGAVYCAECNLHVDICVCTRHTSQPRHLNWPWLCPSLSTCDKLCVSGLLMVCWHNGQTWATRKTRMLEVTPWLPVLVQWVGAKSDYYDCKCYQLAITASHCIQCFKKVFPTFSVVTWARAVRFLPCSYRYMLWSRVTCQVGVLLKWLNTVSYNSPGL